jgi:hypothetical protein
MDKIFFYKKEGLGISIFENTGCYGDTKKDSCPIEINIKNAKATFHMCDKGPHICIACARGGALEQAIAYFENLKLFDRTIFASKQNSNTR